MFHFLLMHQNLQLVNAHSAKTSMFLFLKITLMEVVFLVPNYQREKKIKRKWLYSGKMAPSVDVDIFLNSDNVMHFHSYSKRNNQ